ncbi:MAG: EamA family transporter [Lachnospiraceae bacterium]|nr:EamA family transporter [Lachnospiraceae bacterium]
MKKQERTGAFCVIIAGICWGIIGLFTRQLNDAGFDSVQVTFFRNSFSALILFIYLLGSDKGKLKIKIRDLWIFIGTGICSIAFFNICYFKAIEITSLSVAAVLLYTAPAMVMIMSSILFKEKITVKNSIALLFAFAGCLFTTGLIGSDIKLEMMGILIGLGSGFGYALYSIFGSLAIRKYDTVTITFYTFLIASVGLLPLCKPMAMLSVLRAEPQQIFVGFMLATISTILPFTCYTIGLKYLEAGKASIMAFIEPMVATICGIVIFKEAMTASNAIGILLIFLSVILLNLP